MISLVRLRVKRQNKRLDSGIHAQFFGTKLTASSLILLEEQRSLKKGTLDGHDFNSGIWGKAKDRLLKETSDKCAYCETPTAVVDYGDVEHFRPKSKYWWLAYCVDNYLVSCAICNQKFKSNKFPILNAKLRGPTVRKNASDAALRALAKTLVPDPLIPGDVDKFLDTHDSETTLLVNPYIDDPAEYFAWHADMNIEEVELLPADDSGLVADCVKAAKAVYGLNRSQLRRARFDTFESYLTKKMTLEDAGISSTVRKINQKSLKRMLLDRYPYSGMIRFFENAGTTENWIRQGLLTI